MTITYTDFNKLSIWLILTHNVTILNTFILAAKHHRNIISYFISNGIYILAGTAQLQLFWVRQ